MRQKELSLCHKLKFSNPDIIATCTGKYSIPLISSETLRTRLDKPTLEYFKKLCLEIK